MTLTYEQRLEKTVEQLLPYYFKYYKLMNQPVPEIDVIVQETISKKLPRLFQPKLHPQPK